ncbi:MAG: ATP-binding protein [Dermatophilaceae bacterium]
MTSAQSTPRASDSAPLRADETPGSVADLDARAVLVSLPDGVVVIGTDGRVLFVNPRAARLIGRAASRVVGERVCDALPLKDALGRCWWENDDVSDGLTLRACQREELLTLPGSGHVLVSTNQIRTGEAAGEERTVVVLRHSPERYSDESGTAELLSIVAHELRSPLSSVRTFSDTLLRRWERFSDGQRKLMVETIATDSQRLFRLLNELLDVSRLDTSRLRMNPRPLDVRAMITSHVLRFVRAGHDRDRFTGFEDQGPLEVWADADRVDQILANLIENALMHGAGLVTITAEELVPDDAGERFVAISVADQGPGIPEEVHPMIFKKFWHGTERGSTGLGLYLVKGLVQAHGGQIIVRTAPGGGALFRFTLPASPPPELR